MKDKITVESRVDGQYSARLGSGARITWPRLGSKQLMTKDEIVSMVNLPGGRYAAQHRLIIKDSKLLDELRIPHEPEYFFSKDDMKALIVHGTPEELEEAMEYGGEGIIEMVKSVALRTDIADVRKINIINKKAGCDLMELKENYREAGILDEAPEPKQRKRRNVFDPNKAKSKDEAPKERSGFDPSKYNEKVEESDIDKVQSKHEAENDSLIIEEPEYTRE